MGKFGWDLPPGCRVSDIPGNRPEDEMWEALIDNFFKGLTEKEQESIDNEEIIVKAIEYGMNAQIKEQKRVDEENKFYEERAKEYRKDKERFNVESSEGE